ncbi:MAG: cell division protein FtsH, partial [Pseudomonadota bacterium]
MMLFMQFTGRSTTRDVMDYSTMMSEAKAGNIVTYKEEGPKVAKVTTRENKTYTVYLIGNIYQTEDLLKGGVKIEARPPDEQSFLLQMFISAFPVLLLIGVWIYFMRQMQGGGKGGAFSFGKSRARMLDENTNPITFADVAGVDEAKDEVGELVDFLRDPSKFQKLGGRIPRGVLMVGSPG